MAIRWKVVKPGSYSVMRNYLSKRLAKRYLKNKIITAKRETPGILVFKTKHQAYRFASSNDNVLKVKTIGKGLKIKYLYEIGYLKYINKDDFKKLKELNEKNLIVNDSRVVSAPDGTYGYPAVEVLE